MGSGRKGWGVGPLVGALILLAAAESSAGASGTIAAGDFHSCAVIDGVAHCWGFNSDGQLGDGTTVYSSVPVPVAGPLRNDLGVAAGHRHSCALTAAGGVECWGNNDHGQLGNGTTQDSSTPVPVTGLSSGVAAVAAGLVHSCALLASGGVQCWGRNGFGQLGNGTLTPSDVPVAVVGLSGAVEMLAAGVAHTCALLASGAIQCWGKNEHGQLGTSTGSDGVSTPVTASTGAATAVAGGGNHTCALLTGGEVECWGRNQAGQLGDGTTTERSLPAPVLGLPGASTAVAAGGDHTCAVGDAGDVWCWGDNAEGQLGDGTTSARTTPVAVAGLAEPARTIVAGATHTCALSAMGAASCWGSNETGQLGEGSTLPGSVAPLAVAGLPEGATSVAAGGAHTCALLDGGGVACWGRNVYGQLGTGDRVSSRLPVPGPDLSSGVAALAAGLDHTCALSNAGAVYCWGWNASGQLGDGTTWNKVSPAPVAGLSSVAVAITAGRSHTCALLDTGVLECWGANSSGQLGDGTTTNRTMPVAVTGLASAVVAVSAGASHTCAVSSLGGAHCWGANSTGQLGDGSVVSSPVPVAVAGLASGVAGIAAGYFHTCAVSAAGAATCWGAGAHGALGHGFTGARTSPSPVSGLSTGVTGIAAGSNHTCATALSGSLLCWGENGWGRLGDGTTTNAYVPVAVAGLPGAVSWVSAGVGHTCALPTSGGLLCWGKHIEGQLGVGGVRASSLPLPVVGLDGFAVPSLHPTGLVALVALLLGIGASRTGRIRRASA